MDNDSHVRFLVIFILMVVAFVVGEVNNRVINSQASIRRKNDQQKNLKKLESGNQKEQISMKKPNENYLKR